TRDITELSGLGRQAPVMTVASAVAIAGMVGLPPTLGFAAKEGALTAFLDEASAGSGWGWVALAGIVLGSVLTTAYGIRFVWGAFGTKKHADGTARARTEWPDPPIWFLAAPVGLAAVALLGGPVAGALGGPLQRDAATLPGATPGRPSPDHAAHPAR